MDGPDLQKLFGVYQFDFLGQYAFFGEVNNTSRIKDKQVASKEEIT